MTMGSLVESTNKSGETEIKGLVGRWVPTKRGVPNEWNWGRRQGFCRQSAIVLSLDGVTGDGRNKEKLLLESQSSVATGVPDSLSGDWQLTPSNGDGLEGKVRGSVGKS